MEPKQKPSKLMLFAGILIGLMLIWIGASLFFSKEKTETAENGVPYTPEEAPILALGWSRFEDSRKQFTIDIPEIAETITNSSDMAAVGYIPTCNPETSIVCSYFPKTMYPRTNFDGAGVSVNITDARTATTCLETGMTERDPLEDTVIGGMPFKTFPASDAAMSHQSSGTNYRTWHENTCYELTTRINSTTFEVYEEGSIQRFTDENRETVERILEKILLSFRFTRGME